MAMTTETQRKDLALREVTAIVTQWVKVRKSSKVGAVQVLDHGNRLEVHIEVQAGSNFDSSELASLIDRKATDAHCDKHWFVEGWYEWDSNFYVRSSIQIDVRF